MKRAKKGNRAFTARFIANDDEIQGAFETLVARLNALSLDFFVNVQVLNDCMIGISSRACDFQTIKVAAEAAAGIQAGLSGPLNYFELEWSYLRSEPSCTDTTVCGGGAAFAHDGKLVWANIEDWIATRLEEVFKKEGLL